MTDEATSPRPGEPGLFFLNDALIVRRHGACSVFPRAAIVAIDEQRKTHDAALARDEERRRTRLEHLRRWLGAS